MAESKLTHERLELALQCLERAAAACASAEGAAPLLALLPPAALGEDDEVDDLGSRFFGELSGDDEDSTTAAEAAPKSGSSGDVDSMEESKWAAFGGDGDAAAAAAAAATAATAAEDFAAASGQFAALDVSAISPACPSPPQMRFISSKTCMNSSSAVVVADCASVGSPPLMGAGGFMAAAARQ